MCDVFVDLSTLGKKYANVVPTKQRLISGGVSRSLLAKASKKMMKIRRL
jgi:hypothetical protein